MNSIKLAWKDKRKDFISLTVENPEKFLSQRLRVSTRILFNFYLDIFDNVYPELTSDELVSIKNDYPEDKILIIPIPRESWVIPDRWKDSISYYGDHLGKIYNLDNKYKKFLVTLQNDLRYLSPDDIRDLLTISVTRTLRPSGKICNPELLPTYILFEGNNNTWWTFELWDKNFDDPEIRIYDFISNKKSVTIHLRVPELMRFTKITDYTKLLKP